MFISVFRLRKRWIAGALCLLMALAAGGFWLWTRPKSATFTEAPDKTPQKVVYLTFDDGPSKVTADILDLLKEEQVPATFFVIGATTDRGKQLYQRILDEGHAIGIHSYSHRYGQIYESAEAYLSDFDQLSDYLYDTVGIRPNIFRFPGGSTNATADPQTIKAIKKEMAKRGNVYFDWNAIAKDDKSKPTAAETMYQNILKSAGDVDRILVLMHDDSLRTTAVDCLKLLIDHYRTAGYTFEALTADTPPIQFASK